MSHAMERPRKREAEQRDKLTGLRTKETLSGIVEEAIQNTPGEFALLMLDVDDFKDLNIAIGPNEADKKLIILGMTLTENLRQTDESTAARRSGDEFFIFLPGVTTPEQVLSVAERIQELCAKEGIRVSVGGKVHEIGETREELEDACAELMGLAKQKNRTNLLSPEQHRAIQPALEILYENRVTPAGAAWLLRGYIEKRRG